MSNTEKRDLFKKILENYGADPSISFVEAGKFIFDDTKTATDPMDIGDVGMHDYIRAYHTTTPEEFEAERAAANAPEASSAKVSHGSNARETGIDAMDFADFIGQGDISDLGDGDYEVYLPKDAKDFNDDDYIHTVSMEQDPELVLGTKEEPPANTEPSLSDSVSPEDKLANVFNTHLLTPEELSMASEVLFKTGSAFGVNFNLWNALKDLSRTVQEAELDGSYKPELIEKLKNSQLKIQKEFIRTKLYPERVSG